MCRKGVRQDAAGRDRAERVERRFAVPVLLAAAVSVPAVFLTMVDDPAVATAGTALNWASLAVLSAEAVVLFLLSGDRLNWLRRHWWTVVVTALAVPAVIFAVGPAQVLRLIHFLGALRILRANRILKAGLVLTRRLRLAGPWRRLTVFGASLAAAGFVAVVLADPTSTTRTLLMGSRSWPGIVLVVLAGAVLATATFLVTRARLRRPDPAVDQEQRDEPAPR